MVLTVSAFSHSTTNLLSHEVTNLATALPPPEHRSHCKQCKVGEKHLPCQASWKEGKKNPYLAPKLVTGIACTANRVGEKAKHEAERGGPRAVPAFEWPLPPEGLLEVNYDSRRIKILDVDIKRVGNRTNTDTYRKPTDANSFLASDSFHPQHLKNTLFSDA